MSSAEPKHMPETKPNPDPTIATNEAVERAMKSERDFVNGKIEMLEQRLTGIDTATRLRYETLGHLTNKEDLLAEIRHLTEITGEKFDSVEKQFELVERQRVEQKKDCVAADTLILCADLVWRPAGELVIGDELITVDDDAVTVPGERTPRRFRRGVVTANRLEEDELLHVITPVGDLICNPHHPILVKRPTQGGRLRYWHWVPAEELVDGDFLMYAVDMMVKSDLLWEGQSIGGRNRGVPMLSVKPIGTGTIAMLTVSTGTYIAGGFASHNTKDAVDAALAAAKEAVKEQTTASGLSIAKSETATTEQMKQLNATFTAALQGIVNSIDDLKERLSRIENRQLGASEQRDHTREGVTSIQAILAIIIAFIVIGTGIYAITQASNEKIVPVTVTTQTP